MLPVPIGNYSSNSANRISLYKQPRGCRLLIPAPSSCSLLPAPGSQLLDPRSCSLPTAPGSWLWIPALAPSSQLLAWCVCSNARAHSWWGLRVPPATERGFSHSEEHPISLQGDARPFSTCKQDWREPCGLGSALGNTQSRQSSRAGLSWAQEDLLHKDRR